MVIDRSRRARNLSARATARAGPKRSNGIFERRERSDGRGTNNDGVIARAYRRLVAFSGEGTTGFAFCFM